MTDRERIEELDRELDKLAKHLGNIASAGMQHQASIYEVESRVEELEKQVNKPLIDMLIPEFEVSAVGELTIIDSLGHKSVKVLKAGDTVTFLGKETDK